MLVQNSLCDLLFKINNNTMSNQSLRSDLLSLISELDEDSLHMTTKNVYISILVTRSTAEELNLKPRRLQGFKGHRDGSVYYTLIGKNQLTRDGVEDLHIAYIRSVDMNDSSTSVTAMDDLSDENIQARANNSESTYFLRPEIVRTSSLMEVSTKVHEGNLEIVGNKIVVTVYDNQLPSDADPWKTMCRICHGGESYEQLVGPCLCRGTVELCHQSCLEQWLRVSQKSECELCKHHYEIRREPKYGIMESIYVWLRNPGHHGVLLLEDLISFCLYTPASICTSYILMVICDNASRNVTSQHQIICAHITTFLAITGIAAIDFTFSTWLMVTLHRHVVAWRTWYRENSLVTLILPPEKRARIREQQDLGNNSQQC